MGWFRGLAAAAVIMLAGCGKAFDGVDGTIARWNFGALCSQNAGLTVTRPVQADGVISDRSGIAQNLWLLFDAGASFVEFEAIRDVFGDGDFSEWSDGKDHAVWRIERVPRGDARCTAFDTWLGRQADEKKRAFGLDERWTKAATYKNECFAVTPQDGFTPLVSNRITHESTAAAKPSHCSSASGTRIALKRNGSPVFVVQSYRAIEQTCVIASFYSPPEMGYCADPARADLFGGRRVFVRADSPEEQADLEARSKSCNGKCKEWDAGTSRAVLTDLR